MFLLSDIQYVIDFPGLGNEQQSRVYKRGFNVYNTLERTLWKLMKVKMQVVELEDELEKCKVKPCLGVSVD